MFQNDFIQSDSWKHHLALEQSISLVKTLFEKNLCSALTLHKTDAPIFVHKQSGINDNLNGVERPVTFSTRNFPGQEMEVVQSLAKWKRLALMNYHVPEGQGIITDMKAIRPDEMTDETHSIYVDQWDWEMAIREEDRSLAFLVSTVQKIYEAIRKTESELCNEISETEPSLAENISFIHAEKLLQLYPGLNPRERENRLTAECGALFVIGIGFPLDDGIPHDLRAPDYDDWISPTSADQRGLNGDLLVWNKKLGKAVELSSMGIRVSPPSLLDQLRMTGCMERAHLPWHRKLLDGSLPPSIGGGIGQSRLIMHLLGKSQIRDVQPGYWLI